MDLELRKINSENFYSICQLELNPEQECHIDSNAISLAEANFMEFAWFRAIYLNNAPIGFILVDANVSTNTFMLWRFMLDKSCQSKGLGRNAIQMLVVALQKEFGISELFTSVISGEGSPLGFYRRCGFIPTGNLVADREIELCLSV